MEADGQQAGYFELHISSSTAFLYAVNVFFAYLSYTSVFAEAVMVPFQAMVMPRSWGPNWLYIFVVLVV